MHFCLIFFRFFVVALVYSFFCVSSFVWRETIKLPIKHISANRKVLFIIAVIVPERSLLLFVLPFFILFLFYSIECIIFHQKKKTYWYARCKNATKNWSNLSLFWQHINQLNFNYGWIKPIFAGCFTSRTICQICKLFYARR